MKTKEELYSETFEVMNVNDKEVLFTCLRINRDIVPESRVSKSSIRPNPENTAL